MRHKGALSAVLVINVLAAACARPEALATPNVEVPVIKIDAGLTPRMSAEQVEAVALNEIHAMESMVGAAVRAPRIVTITATTNSGVEKLEPGSGHGDPPALGIQWLVRAEGTFTNNRTPPGANPMVAATGFFIIGDADGGIVGFGFP